MTFGTAMALAGAIACGGCSRGRATHQTVSAVAPPVAAQAATPPVPPASTEQHGQGQGKRGDINVYVDGKPVAITRFGELPPGLKAYSRDWVLGGKTAARFFRVSEYLTALGIDLAKVRAVQFHGSWGRVASVDGDELLKNKERLLFDFTGESYGKPRMRWSTVGLRVPTSIDIFQAITVYVDKTAPAYDPASQTMVLNGEVVDGPPYVTEEFPHGTRVYVDGKLVGAVKRRQLSKDAVVNGDDPSPKYSFGLYLGSLGVDPSKAKAIDIVSGDDLVFRASARDFAKNDKLVFSMTNHAKGKVSAHLPGNKSARVTSVQVFVKTAPPARQVEPESLDEDSIDNPQPAKNGGTDLNNPNSEDGQSED